MVDRDPWKTRFPEEEEADDLFIEEGDDDETKSKKHKVQNEMRNKGILLVSESEWEEKLKETLIEACEDEERRKIYNPRAQLLFCSLSLLFCDVPVAVAVVVCLSSLLFCRGRRQRNIQRFITHVHSYCIAQQIIFSVTLPLPLPLSSWLS